ncbi:hypothetical protein ACKGJO_06555 [Gracilimonas sp. Q87]|uniref:hypothetical protein n=1 Tax=Gracilimonas sp. Q87 TaxID=3384766 RepID=UPI0039843E38
MTPKVDVEGQTLSFSAFSDGQEFDLNPVGLTQIAGPIDQETTLYLSSDPAMPLGEFFLKIFTPEVVVSKEVGVHYGDNPYEFE